MIDQYVGGTRYDSELLTARVNAMRNADLVLIIRVFYDPYHPAGGHGQITDAWNQQVPVVSWSSTAQFDDWCDQCEEAAEGTWNDKLWLVPSSTWGYDWPPSGEPTHRPNVKCGLDLRRTRDRNQAHLRLRCYRLAAGAAYRSSMCAASAYQAPMCVHDPHRGYFDDADALPTQYFGASGDSHFQVTIAHEIGHWLGLNHVNQGGAGCVVGGETICYGSTSRQREDVMGMGSRVEAWHALPWKRRIGQHVLYGDPEWLRQELHWHATSARPRPQRIQHHARAAVAPGGVADLDAGTHGAY